MNVFDWKISQLNFEIIIYIFGLWKLKISHIFSQMKAFITIVDFHYHSIKYSKKETKVFKLNIIYLIKIIYW